MAPSQVEKKTKCKKYTYTDHSKYKQWEKERRDKFKHKLEELASHLPNFDKENPWKKFDILDNAILCIKDNSKRKDRGDHEHLIKKLTAEVTSLKKIILKYTNFPSESKEILKLTSREILAELLASEQGPRSPTNVEDDLPEAANEDTSNDNLAFVAKIAQPNDHCYSSTEPELR